MKKVHPLGEEYIRNLHLLEPCLIELESGAKTLGLMPEDVMTHFPNLVNLDRDGKPISVRYDLLAILALMEVKSLRAKLNAFYRDYKTFRDGTEKAMLTLTDKRSK